MQYCTTRIEQELYTCFGAVYKAFGGFVDSGEVWDACLAAVRDVTLMGHIIFCNDVHQIPPVHSFLKVAGISRDLSEMEKRSVGAFWGFVFKFVFGYRNQKSATARVNTVKTATYFLDVAEPVTVVSEYQEEMTWHTQKQRL